MSWIARTASIAAICLIACASPGVGGGADSSGAGGATADPGSGGGDGSSDASGTGGTDGDGSDAGTASTTGGEPDCVPASGGDPTELPTEVPTVEILVDPNAIAQLDQNPFHSPDMPGTFIDGSGTRYETVDVNYRGAYALRGLIQNGGKQRNWKVKFSKLQKYRDRREWNFNYERHLRQKLAYDLMRFAGIAVPKPRHVLLMVNGDPHGLYLEYEDPDNKAWLADMFCDDWGDLYKGGYDLPDEEPRWALTTYLGGLDEDYFLHYRKQRNLDGMLETDYHTIRELLFELNMTPDTEIRGWYQQSFAVESFLSYLVVANFTSDWDSLPQRPKNYWLYDNPHDGRWVFVPWDLDLTFNPSTFPLNPMGTDASVFWQLDGYEPYQGNAEGTERPLVRRLIGAADYRDAYISRYKELYGTILDETFLLDRIQQLTDLVAQHASVEDHAELVDQNDALLRFVSERYANVGDQLDGL